MQDLRPWPDSQANRIEHLCNARRIPVCVLGGVVTPRLVRFHLALDPRIPLKRLNALAEDLALALSAPSTRLSRDNGLLTLEIPHPHPAGISLVRLQAGVDLLPEFAALLGRDEEGAPLLLRIPSPEIAHVLIAGTTGSGKTALARTILCSLALANDPDELRVLLIDPKGRGFAPLGLPHLTAPPIREGEEANRRLQWLAEEMEWREQSGITSPRVIVAVDELADLLSQTPGVGDTLTRLAARGRESGIHLLLATQKPTASAIGSLLRANLPCRLVGRVVSAQEAVTAAGIKETGAEKLLGRGDFILVARGETIRFQAAYITSAEIRVMVEMLQEEVGLARPQQTPEREGKVIPFPGQWVKKKVAAFVGALAG